MTRFKKIFASLALVAISVAGGVLMGEFAARMILNRGDYLSVEMVPDPALGAVPSPNARSGFDSWGFRNRSVPSTADLVAIGDSHTYGNTATMEDSWPYVLGHLAGQRVYNLSMGGYGPNQYYYLLKNRALSLKPKTILCGLYMGDDFENAFTITYGLDYWSDFRRTQFQNASFNIWDTAAPNLNWHKQVRVWLSRHSVIYQLTLHGPLMGLLHGDSQILRAPSLYPGVATTLNLPEKHILEAFRPEGIFRRLDQHSESVQEGMRLTFELLRRMNDLCAEQHIRFVVVVIPTKEMVFSEYLEHNPNLPLSNVLDSLITNERVALTKTFQFLSDAAIPYVDPLPALQASVSDRLYARSAEDMHPSRNGYRVIAKAAVQGLRQLGSGKNYTGGVDCTKPK